MRWMWICVEALGWLAFIGWCVSVWSTPTGVLEWGLAGVCWVAWPASSWLRPEVRAQRYRTAASIVAVVIARYAEDSDCSESALREAAQRAEERLRIKRIRIAPEWIRLKRRHYRLRVLAWPISAILLAMPLVFASIHFRWRTAGFWSMLIVVLLLFVVSVIRTRGLVEACQVLRGVIERYEFETAAGDEGALIEADQTVSALLEKPSPHSP